MLRPALVIASLLLLGGCGGGQSIGSILGGECKLVHTSEYVVLGQTRYDQKWIDITQESLVAGCNQARPKKRPTSFNKPKVVKISADPDAIPLPPVKAKRKLQDKLRHIFD